MPHATRRSAVTGTGDHCCLLSNHKWADDISKAVGDTLNPKPKALTRKKEQNSGSHIAADFWNLQVVPPLIGIRVRVVRLPKPYKALNPKPIYIPRGPKPCTRRVCFRIFQPALRWASSKGSGLFRLGWSVIYLLPIVSIVYSSFFSFLV